MPLDLVYSASALADLKAILAYVALDSPQGARAWVAQIEQRCLRLRDFPELGVQRDDIAAGLRILPYWRASSPIASGRTASVSSACFMADRTTPP